MPLKCFASRRPAGSNHPGAAIVTREAIDAETPLRASLTAAGAPSKHSRDGRSRGSRAVAKYLNLH
jgi:hypothetical protein